MTPTPVGPGLPGLGGGRPTGLRRAARATLRALMAIGPLRAALRPWVRTGTVPLAVWARLPVRADFAVPLPGGGGFRYAAVPEDLWGRALYWRGVLFWEGETIAVALGLMRRARDFWDVGASTGVYTLLACAANPGIVVHAFEPVPAVHDRLVRNVRLNGWEGRCALHRAALGAAAGTRALHVPTTDTLPTSASLDPGGYRGLPGTLVEVPVTTLCDAGRDGAPLDLVKIDVEGFEDEVLEGAGPLLEERQPAIVVECTLDGPSAAVGRRLGRLGYRFFHLRPEGPVARPGIVPDPTERWRNYLCLPEGKLAWLEAAPRTTPGGGG